MFVMYNYMIKKDSLIPSFILISNVTASFFNSKVVSQVIHLIVKSRPEKMSRGCFALVFLILFVQI